MHLIDFYYDGHCLSDFNLTIASLEGEYGFNTVDVGNNISLLDVKVPNANHNTSVGYQYGDNFSVTFTTIKHSCEFDDEAMTDYEINRIMRWLNCKEYKKFKPFYDDGSFHEVYYKATFNCKVITTGNEAIGFEMTMTTNAPYGFGEPVELLHKFDDTEDGQQFLIEDVSDEIGHLYCDVEIKCLEDGDLVIDNILDNNQFVLKNCVADEIITIYGERKIILSNVNHPKIYNDFNYNYIRINNTRDDVTNVFTSSLKCEMRISYSPIMKVGVII